MNNNTEEKQFYIAYAKCKKYSTKVMEDINDLDFDYIYDYIVQKHYTAYYLNLLFDVIPLGALKLRLRQQLKSFGIEK